MTLRTLMLVALTIALSCAVQGADPKKKDTKKKTPPSPPRNAVAELAEKANRPTFTGVVEVTKTDKGFLRATFTSEGGEKFTIVNPAIVEDFSGQKVKIVYADLKTDPKTKAKSLRVEEVQKAGR